ncbi:MAG: hypothetical protein O3A00_26465 [Planctomycetota bacterium]|nr:hypothetical protein [Planctomycetota bacterium]
MHVPTWASPRAAKLWGDASGGNLWQNGLDQVSQRICELPAEKLWSFRTQQRLALVEYVGERCTSVAGGPLCQCGRGVANCRSTKTATRFAKSENLCTIQELAAKPDGVIGTTSWAP